MAGRLTSAARLFTQVQWIRVGHFGFMITTIMHCSCDAEFDSSSVVAIAVPGVIGVGIKVSRLLGRVLTATPNQESFMGFQPPLCINATTIGNGPNQAEPWHIFVPPGKAKISRRVAGHFFESFFHFAQKRASHLR